MANLHETATWEAGIYQWETSDPVMGGENGIDNKPTRQLANRTLWLKTELAKAVESIGSNKSAADIALGTKADKNTTITAGNGLTGGGNLSANLAISLGTPSTITATSGNTVAASSHTHEIDKASTTTPGIVQLNNTLSSSATNQALTAAMGKKLQDEKIGNTAIDRPSGNNAYSLSGFFRGNGDVLNNNSLPSMEIHIAHPAYSNAGHARGIGFSYGGTSFNVSTTAWDAEGNYLGEKTILTEENGVMLNGNQTISGVKTFNNIQKAFGGIQVANNEANAAESNAGIVSANHNAVFVQNLKNSKFLELRHDGILVYDGQQVYTRIDSSNAVNSDDADKIATSRAVKTAYDKAVQAATATRRSYNRTINGTASGHTNQTMSVTGETIISPDGSVVQYFHIKNVKLIWFGFEDEAVGNYGPGDKGRLINIDLWTAMPNKVCYASIQFVRATDTQISQRWQAEASEHKYSWNPRNTNKNTVSFNSRRWYGDSDELIDMVIKVEGY